MTSLNDSEIIDAWHENAEPWTNAVRSGQIESRREVTDAAVVDTITHHGPSRLLDIGCGEGWLARALAAKGMDITGFDVVPDLVSIARQAGGGNFQVASYEEFATGSFPWRGELAVCNFSLLGQAATEGVIRALPHYLTAGGKLVVQTLHPVAACGDLPYRDGWREGSWAGFSSDFRSPAPWYFRTLESWVQLFTRCGFRLLDLHEPIHPRSQQPLSVIFTAQSPV